MPTLAAEAAPATTCDTSVAALDELFDELPDELPGFEPPCLPPCELAALDELAVLDCDDELDVDVVVVCVAELVVGELVACVVALPDWAETMLE